MPLVQFILYAAANLFKIIGLDGLSSQILNTSDYLIGTDISFFGQSFLIGFLLLAILALSFYIKRFWCRYLCPLGAMLGFLSFKPFLRINQNEKCGGCGACSSACDAAASPDIKNGPYTMECMMLGSCISSCPQSSLSYGLNRTKKESAKTDMEKRRFGLTLIAGVLTAPLLRAGLNPERAESSLIRPPGAHDELIFLDKCIRCEACIRVCPENFLQPALFEGRLEGLWTPVGNGNTGFCEWGCNLCGKVCPTEAIKELSLPEKQKTSIGLAFIDKNRCLPYAFDKNCIVCEEHCPTASKAIVFNEIEKKDSYGKLITLKQPVVIPELCIGCAICQYKCPVIDKPAIYITSIGESRSSTNRFIQQENASPYG